MAFSVDVTPSLARLAVPSSWEGIKEKGKSAGSGLDAERHRYHAAPAPNVPQIDRLSRNILSPVFN